MKNKLFKNKTKGFSLVELIVVIAIMAVLAAVLAPALIKYTEESRAKKDDSAVGEVVNTTMLALSEQDTYDEILELSVIDNYSCYTDNKNNDFEHVIRTKKINGTDTSIGDKDYWLYNDDCRKMDEIKYAPAGRMRGVTITFTPKKKKLDFKNGVINNMGEPKGPNAGKLVSELQNAKLYNRIRQVMNNAIHITSAQYRNSAYTLFISIGSTGGKQASAQDAIKVYGQWNGTNLTPDSVSAPDVGGTGESGAPGNTEETRVIKSTYFATFKDAVGYVNNAVGDGVTSDAAVFVEETTKNKTIKLLTDTIIDKDIAITSPCTIDINGNTVSTNKAIYVKNNTDFVLKDSKKTGVIKMNSIGSSITDSKASIVRIENSNATIENCNLILNENNDKYSCGVYSYNSNVTLKNCDITANCDAGYVYGALNTNGGTIHIDGGTYSIKNATTGFVRAVCIQDDAKLYCNNAKFTVEGPQACDIYSNITTNATNKKNEAYISNSTFSSNKNHFTIDTQSKYYIGKNNTFEEKMKVNNKTTQTDINKVCNFTEEEYK